MKRFWKNIIFALFLIPVLFISLSFASAYSYPQTKIYLSSNSYYSNPYTPDYSESNTYQKTNEVIYLNNGYRTSTTTKQITTKSYDPYYDYYSWDNPPRKMYYFNYNSYPYPYDSPYNVQYHYVRIYPNDPYQYYIGYSVRDNPDYEYSSRVYPYPEQYYRPTYSWQTGRYVNRY